MIHNSGLSPSGVCCTLDWNICWCSITSFNATVEAIRVQCVMGLFHCINTAVFVWNIYNILKILNPCDPKFPEKSRWSRWIDWWVDGSQMTHERLWLWLCVYIMLKTQRTRSLCLLQRSVAKEYLFFDGDSIVFHSWKVHYGFLQLEKFIFKTWTRPSDIHNQHCWTVCYVEDNVSSANV